MDQGRARLLTALLLAVLSLGFYRALTPEDELWFDEAFTANLVTFQTSPKDVVGRVATGDAHPPLFYLYAWGCARATGFWGSALEGPPDGVEKALRACNLPVVAATFGALGLLLPAPAAFLGAGLLAATPSYADKAVEARMYPLVGLFLLLAVAAALRERPWAFSLWSLLALYTHYLAALFLAPLALLLLLQGWRRKGARALLPFSPLLLSLPWLPVFLRQLEGGANAWLRPAPFLALYAYQDYGGHLLVSLLLLALLFLGVWAARGEPRAWTGLAVAAFPLLWALQATLGLNTVSERYFGSFAPAFLLAVLALAPREAVRLAWPGLGLAALLGVLAVAADPPRFSEPYRTFSAVLSALEREGPVEVLGNEGGRLVALRYYHRSPSTFRLVSEEDVKAPPARFVVLFYGAGAATRQGELLLELHERLTREGHAYRPVPPLSPTTLVRYWREP